jgi:hypothetical protein
MLQFLKKSAAMKTFLLLNLISFLFLITNCFSQQLPAKVDVLIIGGGSSGTAAGMQAAREGASVLIIEETSWLGGMLTAAGVAAVDGNHNIAFGIWGEFRQKLRNHYGGASALATGWVSNTLFEPHVGDSLLKVMADIPGLQISYNSRWEKLTKTQNGWQVTVSKDGSKRKTKVEGTIIIDATEYGDILASAGVPYEIGMDDPAVEPLGPGRNDIIQDLTWVAILKDFGEGADKTIPKPANYKTEEFSASCMSEENLVGLDCQKMLDYGKLPNNKYMLNWPNSGNDAYINVIEATAEERAAALEEAKQTTLRFIYFIQHDLGFKHLGIADDEFPTKDGLALIPYNRESRRAETLVHLTVADLANQYTGQRPLYRTGIALGDYPIDHHHTKNLDSPKIEFIEIKIPSYNVPIGSLIPKKVENLIIAEKNIGVSNIVNGSTRLQPVVLGIGQAAGTIAAHAVKENIQPREVSIRSIQQALLEYNAGIMPFMDVSADDPQFKAIHRVGAAGWLEGVGIAYKWANQTWFYPNLAMNRYDLVEAMEPYFPEVLGEVGESGDLITYKWLQTYVESLNPNATNDSFAKEWENTFAALPELDTMQLYRRHIAAMLDHFLSPFSFDIDFEGHIKPTKEAK